MPMLLANGKILGYVYDRATSWHFSIYTIPERGVQPQALVKGGPYPSELKAEQALKLQFDSEELRLDLQAKLECHRMRHVSPVGAFRQAIRPDALFLETIKA